MNSLTFLFCVINFTIASKSNNIQFKYTLAHSVKKEGNPCSLGVFSRSILHIRIYFSIPVPSLEM